MDRLTLSLVAAPLVFLLAAVLTRPDRRRLGAALAGALVFAAGNLGWDLLAHRAGWWTYPTVGAPAPLVWYGAAGISAAGVALVGWRVARRWGWGALVGFCVLFGGFCVLRDHLAARDAARLIVFGPGPVPRLADGVAGASLMAAATLTIIALSGSPCKRRGRRLAGGGQT